MLQVVLTRNEARALWGNSGLDYSVLTKESLKRLSAYINAGMKEVGTMKGTYRMRRSVYLHERDGRPIRAELRCRSYYFDDREAVSFNDNGFIRFAGWADNQNVQPMLAGFERWVRELAREPRP